MDASIHTSSQVKQGNFQGIFNLIKLSGTVREGAKAGAGDEAGAGAVIRNSGSKELKPKEIFYGSATLTYAFRKVDAVTLKVKNYN